MQNRSRYVFVIGTAVLAAVAGVFLFSNPSEKRTEPPAPEDHIGTPVDWDNHEQVTLILSGTIRAELEACGCTSPPQGGLARRLHLIEDIRAQRSGPVYLVESGDSLFSGMSRIAHAFPQVAIKKAEVVAKYMTRARPSAISLGELDLVMGLDPLRKAVGDIERVVATNYRIPGVESSSIIRLPVGDRSICIASVWDVGATAATHLAASDVKHLDAKSSLQGLQWQDTDALALVLLHSFGADVYGDIRTALSIPTVVVSDQTLSSSPEYRLSRDMIVAVPPERGTDLLVLDLYIPKDSESAEWYDLSVLDNLQESIRRLQSGVAQGQTRPSVDRSVIESLRNRLQVENEKRKRRLCFRFSNMPIHLKMAQSKSMRKDILEYLDWASTQEIPKGHLHSEGISRYSGAANCKECHKSQYTNWMSTLHSKAYETLEAKGMAQNLECISCHTTGFLMTGGPARREEIAPFKAVQCESCHVPTAKGHPKTGAFQPVTAKVCARCHTEATSPSFSYQLYKSRSTCKQLHKARPGDH